jgi:hypothetical protein
MPRAADPVVEVRTVTTRVCPPELLATPAAKPARPAGGAITGDPATIAWFGAVVRWADGVLAMFNDAASACR